MGVPSRTGKMKSISKCDAQYFGIMRKQCKAMDTVTRQVLERAYEAILDAGLNPNDLKGSNTGVFFGSTISETEALLVLCKASDGYFIMGRNRGLNANRLSYWLDLKGTPDFYLNFQISLMPLNFYFILFYFILSDFQVIVPHLIVLGPTASLVSNWHIIT